MALQGIGKYGGQGVNMDTGLDTNLSKFAPEMSADYGVMQKPITPSSGSGPSAGQTAMRIGGSVGAGASAGSVFGPVGTVVGGALGLVEGILSTALGASAAREEQQSQVEQFNKKMRDYYRRVEYYQKKELEASKERKKTEAERKKRQDRIDKYTMALQSAIGQGQAQQAIIGRWKR